MWLNPADLRRLSVHLSLDSEQDLFTRQIVAVEAAQHGIRRPRLRFILTPAGRQCRFLINDLDEDGRLWGRCSLHRTDAKPLVCRLAPLARTIDLDSGEEQWREVPPVIGCPGWIREAPPARGRPVDQPDLDQSLRDDLDGETRYFRWLRDDAKPAAQNSDPVDRS